MTHLSSEQAQFLLEAARKASENAYVPYSHFPVGAAILLENGDVVSSANVENASFGLTICAERNAVTKAVTDGQKKFQAIAVWAKQRPFGAVTPCGACRQVLAEFFSKNSPVVMTEPETGKLRILSIEALLPYGFEFSAASE
jgi:cytidine deaminase